MVEHLLDFSPVEDGPEYSTDEMWTQVDEKTRILMEEIVKDRGQIDIKELVERVSEKQGVDPEDSKTNIRYVLWMGISNHTLLLSSDRHISTNPLARNG